MQSEIAPKSFIQLKNSAFKLLNVYVKSKGPPFYLNGK